MKKVALCLKGAVGKKGGPHDRFYIKDQLYNNGEYIDYKSVRDSVFKHIIKPNEDKFKFDIFLHCWNLDIKEDLIGLYKPEKQLFENNQNYNDIISSVINHPNDFGGVSGSLSLKKSLELKEIYEVEQNFDYDIVIVYRYDVLLWKDIILDDYKLDDFVYVNAWDGSCNADYHFIMSNKNSHKFKYLYDSIYFYQNYHKFHYWIQNYIVNVIKCNIKEDNIIAGQHQEHMRVLGENYKKYI